MTTVQEEKIARRKLSLLQLAQELGNVSKACRITGYSRQHRYEIRRNFQVYGADTWPTATIPCPNRSRKRCCGTGRVSSRGTNPKLDCPSRCQHLETGRSRCVPQVSGLVRVLNGWRASPVLMEGDKRSRDR